MSGDKLEDRAVAAQVEGPELLARGYRPYERFRVTLPNSDAGVHERDIVRVGKVVAIVAVDLARDEIVLVREFRIGAHLATGKGDLVQVPAGRVERDEPLIEAARRECLEETGVEPTKLVELFGVMPSPVMSDEHHTYFLAAVDASKVPEKAGLAAEREETQPIRVKIDDALAAMSSGSMQYGAARFGLQWLELNRSRLAELLK
ncbi:MAG: NUDIX hydrolase [Pseudomonadota bacterium]